MGAPGLRDLSEARFHLASCALDRAGGVHCWGSNRHLELCKKAVSYYTPRPLHIALPARTTAVRLLGNCWLASDGNVYCCGHGPSGDTDEGGADEDAARRAGPNKIAVRGPFRQVRRGRLVDDKGRVWGFGGQFRRDLDTLQCGPRP